MTDSDDEGHPTVSAGVMPTESTPAAITQAADSPALAYSAEETHESDESPSRATGRRVATILAAILATSSSITAAILLIGHHRTPPSVAPAKEAGPAPFIPNLNGTYRIDYDWANQTYRYAKRQGENTITWDKTPDDTSHSTWWAFSSTCTQTGCIATGTQLNNDDHKAPMTPPSTAAMRLVDGAWRDIAPIRSQSECRSDRDNSVMGRPWVSLGQEFARLPNDTFRGTMTETVDTDECGTQGNTIVTPITVTRIGDVPPGLSFDTPPASTLTTTAAPPAERKPATTPTPPPAGFWTDAELAPYDAQVRSRMESVGFRVYDAAAMARAGHAVCAQIQSGVTPDALVQAVASESGINLDQARFFIKAAMEIYPGCS